MARRHRRFGSHSGLMQLYQHSVEQLGLMMDEGHSIRTIQSSSCWNRLTRLHCYYSDQCADPAVLLFARFLQSSQLVEG